MRKRSWGILLRGAALGVVLCAGVPGCGGGREEKIDSKIAIELWENLGPDGRTLELRCETETIYPCCNYPIVYDLDESESAIRIAFLHVLRPTVGLTALGPATATIDLGTLAPGTYDMPITVNGETVAARLVVSEEAYLIEDGDGDWTVFPHPELRRVPDDAVWGLVGYHDAASEPLVQSFFDDLESLGAAQADFAQGYYGYFVVDASGVVEIPGIHGYWFEEHFGYRYDGDQLALRDLVKSYADSHGDELSIRLYLSTGESFMSWLLADG